jgi:hypothetical protein
MGQEHAALDLLRSDVSKDVFGNTAYDVAVRYNNSIAEALKPYEGTDDSGSPVRGEWLLRRETEETEGVQSLHALDTQDRDRNPIRIGIVDSRANDRFECGLITQDQSIHNLTSLIPDLLNTSNHLLPLRPLPINYITAETVSSGCHHLSSLAGHSQRHITVHLLVQHLLPRLGKPSLKIIWVAA